MDMNFDVLTIGKKVKINLLTRLKVDVLPEIDMRFNRISTDYIYIRYSFNPIKVENDKGYYNHDKMNFWENSKPKPSDELESRGETCRRSLKPENQEIQIYHSTPSRIRLFNTEQIVLPHLPGMREPYIHAADNV